MGAFEGKEEVATHERLELARIEVKPGSTDFGVLAGDARIHGRLHHELVPQHDVEALLPSRVVGVLDRSRPRNLVTCEVMEGDKGLESAARAVRGNEFLARYDLDREEPSSAFGRGRQGVLVEDGSDGLGV